MGKGITTEVVKINPVPTTAAGFIFLYRVCSCTNQKSEVKRMRKERPCKFYQLSDLMTCMDRIVAEDMQQRKKVCTQILISAYLFYLDYPSKLTD